MDNATKALYMVGSLFVALMVISLMVYAFNNLGGVQNERDKIQTQEEITKFNTEYEAFNKKIMYGVDVISCINKAISNNEKFVDGGNWSRGGVAGNEALVQIEVKLDNNTLKESIEIYHFNSKGKEVKYMGSGIDALPARIKNLKWSDVLNLSKDARPSVTSLSDELVREKMNQDIPYSIGVGSYQLLEESSSGVKKKFASSGLYELVAHSADMEILIFNDKDYKNASHSYPSSSSNYANLDVVSAPDGWTYIKWTTCFADFKKRKFKCDGVEYNTSTGLIDHITFSEIKK